MIEEKVGMQQRVFAAYRRQFFEKLAANCAGGFGLFAGDARQSEQIPQADALVNGRFVNTHNRHLGLGKFYFLRQPGLLNWVKHFQPQVLIVEANARYLSTPAAIQWVHGHGGKVIGWGLGSPDIHGPGSQWLQSLRSRLYDSLDAIITYSQQGADEYMRAGFKPEMVFIAPNATAEKPRLPLPERLPYFANGKATVLYVGRLQERKRVDLLIKACAKLPSEMQPLLWIVGDGPEKEALQALAARVYPFTRFTGTLYGEQLAEVSRQADLFVLPGTGGLAVQEAMSHGLPVLAAEGDGTQLDLVRDGNGWLLKPGDLNDLTDKLRNALSDPVLLRQMGAASYQIVRDEINIDVMVDRFEAAINYVQGRSA